jgi:hypothetical protein
MKTDLPPNAKSWHTEDKSEWEPGPWVDEPDKVSWTDEATGRPCLIHRGPSGALCGYVAVDPDHPHYKHSYDDLDVEVHGDLTYAALCQEDVSDESEGICHVPEPGAPDDVWWFGFDCAHSGDLSPGHLHVYKKYGENYYFRDAEYRDIAYVVRECEKLAKQLVA